MSAARRSRSIGPLPEKEAEPRSPYQLPTGDPDPPWMKLWHCDLAGGEVGMVMVRQSPRISRAAAALTTKPGFGSERRRILPPPCLACLGRREACRRATQGRAGPPRSSDRGP
jgi:hypothetical protein